MASYVPSYGAYPSQPKTSVPKPIDMDALQRKAAEEERVRNQLLGERTASDMFNQDLQTGNFRGSYSAGPDGFQFNTGGGGSGSGSRGGVSIGGGTYPDLAGMYAQIQGAAPQVQTPPRVAPPTAPSLQNAYQQVKDPQSRIGASALEALRNEMTRRGMSDSGMATMGEANILGNLARQHSQALYDAADVDTGRQWEATQLGYQGEMGQNQMGYQGQIGQRSSDLQLMYNLLNMLY